MADQNTEENQRSFEPLHTACQEGNSDEVAKWIEGSEVTQFINLRHPGDGTTALHMAIEAGNVGIVEMLMSKGADFSLEDNQGRNSMHWAMISKQDGMITELFDKRPESCISLFNERDKRKCTPLMSGLIHMRDKKSKGNSVLFLLQNDGKKLQITEDAQTQPGIIYNKFDLDYKGVTEDGETVLHLAAAVQNTEVLKYIIKKVDDIEFNTYDLESPLTMARERGLWENVKILSPYKKYHKPGDVPVIIHELIEKGECKILSNLIEADKRTFLSHMEKCTKCIHLPLKEKQNLEKMIALLVKNGVDISVSNDSGCTILHELAAEGQTGAIDAIQEHLPKESRFRFQDIQTKSCPKKIRLENADVEFKECLPLHLAAINLHYETVKWLLSNGDADLFKPAFIENDNTGHTPLQLVMTYRVDETVEKMRSFLQKQEKNHKKLKTMDDNLKQLDDNIIEVKEILIKNIGKISDPKKTNKEGKTPLQVSVLNNNIGDTRYWLRQGSDPKFSGPGNKPLLFHAIKSGNEKIAQLLLQFDGYEKDWVDKEGKSMMHYAIESENSEILKLLLKFEVCRLDLLDDEEMSVLHCAVKKRNLQIVKLLVQSGVCNDRVENDVLIEAVKLFSQNQSRIRADAMSIIKLLLQFDVCALNTKDKDGKTALHHAVKFGDKNLIHLLLKFHVCALGTKDKYGKTSLHHAVQSGHKDVVHLLLKFDVCALDTKDTYGKTALHYAVKSGDKDLVHLLLKFYDTSYDTKDNYGKTALHYAVESGDENIVDLLLTFGASDEGLLHMIAFEDQIRFYKKYYKKRHLEREYALGENFKMNIIQGNKCHDKPCTFLEVACLQGHREFLKNVIKMTSQAIPKKVKKSVKDWKDEVKEDCKDVFDEMIIQLKEKRPFEEEVLKQFDSLIKTFDEQIKEMKDCLRKKHGADSVKGIEVQLQAIQQNIKTTAVTAKDFVRAVQSTTDMSFATNAKHIVHQSMFLQISRNVGDLPENGWKKLLESLFRHSTEICDKIKKKISAETKSESECILQSLVYWKYLVCFGHLKEQELKELQKSLKDSGISMKESPKEITDREIEDWRKTGILVDLTEEDLNKLAGKIGRDWHTIGISLGFEGPELENLDQDYQQNTRLRNFTMLSKWKNKEAFNSDRIVDLANKFKECGRLDLAKQVMDIAVINVIEENIESNPQPVNTCSCGEHLDRERRFFKCQKCEKIYEDLDTKESKQKSTVCALM